MTRIILLAFLVLAGIQLNAQHVAMTFDEAEKQGIAAQMDSIYQNAVNADTSLAVFKTDSAITALVNGYRLLLQDLGKFLADSNFVWDKPTRCFNRIYFNGDGTIDYFLFHFMGKEEDRPSAEKQKEFARLLNLFIQNYRIAVTASVKFSQCSPTKYMPK